MPTPMEATVCHATKGRARLRFFGSRQEATLEELGQALAKHPEVDEVRVSFRTGSVLLLHRGELAPILAAAQARGLFVVVRHVEHAPMRRIESAIAEMDRRLAHETGGAFSLGTASFIGFVAAGLYQARRGKLLPAGMTLFTYALEVMQREAHREATYSQTQSGVRDRPS